MLLCRFLFLNCHNSQNFSNVFVSSRQIFVNMLLFLHCYSLILRWVWKRQVQGELKPSVVIWDGYDTECVKSVLEYGFNEIGYNNITTFVAKSNTRSQNVLKRLNFTCEATLRQRDKTPFGIEDCYSYSLLKDEFVWLMLNKVIFQNGNSWIIRK